MLMEAALEGVFKEQLLCKVPDSKIAPPCTALLDCTQLALAVYFVY